jgi:general secretion pathway protein C
MQKTRRNLLILSAAVTFIVVAWLWLESNHKTLPSTPSQAIEVQEPASNESVSPTETAESPNHAIPAIPTKLPLVLVGTVIKPDPKNSVASMRKADTEQSSIYQIGSNIGSIAKVIMIERERLYFRNQKSNLDEYVELAGYNESFAPTKSKIDKTRESEFQLKRSDVDEAIADLPSNLQKARAVPIMDKDGQIQGFQITDIVQGSIFEQIGLKPGDIIDTVEGERVRSVTDALRFFEQFKNSSMIRLGITRDGQSKNLTYLIR